MIVCFPDGLRIQSRSSLVDPKAWAGRSRFKKMLEKVLRVFSIWM